MSEALARGSGQGGGSNQGARGSQVVEDRAQPQEFTMLRTGGPEGGLMVDSIIFQGGRR